MPLRPEPATLRSRLGALLGAVIESIEPLESGAGGTSYLVTTPRGRCVAKVFAHESTVLLDAAAQFALLRELAAAGVAPAPVAVDPAAGLLVTAHIAQAVHLDAAELRAPPRIAALANLLRRLHAVPATIGAYAPLVYADRYLGRLGGIEALAPAEGSRYAELVELAAGFDMTGSVLCHNDLTAENIVFAGEPVLIDFDFAVMAPPILDLACLAAMNGYGPDAAARLLDAYFGGKVPFGAAEFARVERLQRLMAHFWSLAAGSGAASVGQYRIRDD